MLDFAGAGVLDSLGIGLRFRILAVLQLRPRQSDAVVLVCDENVDEVLGESHTVLFGQLFETTTVFPEREQCGLDHKSAGDIGQ